MQLKGNLLIKHFLNEVPTSSGVYKMIGEKGIIYIGKAKNLKSRLKSYTKLEDLNIKNQIMVKNVLKIEYEVTKTEAEALILESSLIKKHKPHFNILLKDDKTKPYIVLSLNHQFPGIFIKRGKPEKGEKYFGPFSDTKAIYDILNIVCKVFKIRSCSDEKLKSAKRACLEFQIKRCSAPCVALISQEDYEKDCFMANRFLLGKVNEVTKILKENMFKFSNIENFEMAANYRDKIFAIEKLLGNEKIDFRRFENIDAILIKQIGVQIGIEVFVIRGGFSYGGSIFFITLKNGEAIEDALEFFLMRHYMESEIPEKIVLNIKPVNLASIEEAFFKLSNKNVKFIINAKGIYANLLEFIEPNLTEKLEKKLNTGIKIKEQLLKLQELLNLTNEIKRIEIYDNSHTNGAFMLGAMVVFGDDGFLKNEYRKFNAKFEITKKGDDYGMLKETLKRRFLNEKLSQIKPDLIIIDGGKGQFSSAFEVFKELKISTPFICMAKGKERNAGKEWFYFENKEFQLEFTSPLLYFLQTLRDEAHRFAITSHRNRRDKI